VTFPSASVFVRTWLNVVEYVRVRLDRGCRERGWPHPERCLVAARVVLMLFNDPRRERDRAVKTTCSKCVGLGVRSRLACPDTTRKELFFNKLAGGTVAVEVDRAVELRVGRFAQPAACAVGQRGSVATPCLADDPASGVVGV
jgi:hypothetical protein